MTTDELEAGAEPKVTFEDLELDPRLTRVLLRSNLIHPTLIQEKAIPLALEGKDILAKARTGSGKTLAYLLPILHQILSVDASSESSATSKVKCLVLVPTKELARQVTTVLGDLLHYAPNRGPGHISVLNLAPSSNTSVNLDKDGSLTLLKSQLQGRPTIIVSTPSRLLLYLPSDPTLLRDLQFLVIDEADLMFSFGYGDDMRRLAREFLPTTMQSFLMSATLNDDVDALKQLILRSPVTLKLHEEDANVGGADGNINGPTSNLQQYSITLEKDEEKFLLMYVILKLKLLPGKILVFANGIERCFRLKLFLEQFAIRSCILNGELPLASRHHILDEFNRGVYDLLIASDGAIQGASSDGKVLNKSQAKKNQKKSSSIDKESGVARGVDFKRVDVVVNFDLPSHQSVYVHRVGRTARGGASGMALSLLVASDGDAKALLSSIPAVQPYDFDRHQLDGFRYRALDALRAVTMAAVRAARLKAVRQEILRSERLQQFWEERPRDLQLLKHDGASGVMAVRAHLKHVPDYLLTRVTDTTESADTSTTTATTKTLKLSLPQLVKRPRKGH